MSDNITTATAVRTADDAAGGGDAKRTVMDRVVWFIEWIAAGFIFLMMLHILISVFGRYFFNQPVPYTQEVAGQFYMPIIALIGMIVAKHRSEHLQAPLIFDQLTWGNRRILVVFQSTLCALVMVLFAYFTFTGDFLHGLKVHEKAGISPFEIWPVLLLLPITFTALAVYYVLDLINAIRGKFDEKNEEDLVDEFLGADEQDELLGDEPELADASMSKKEGDA